MSKSRNRKRQQEQKRAMKRERIKENPDGNSKYARKQRLMRRGIRTCQSPIRSYRVDLETNNWVMIPCVDTGNV